MNLSLVLTISLAAFAVNGEECNVSSCSIVDILVSSHKNQTGHWIFSVDSRSAKGLTVAIHQDDCDIDGLLHFITTATLSPPEVNASLQESCVAHPSTTAASEFPEQESNEDDSEQTMQVTDNSTNTTIPYPGYRLFPGFGWYKAHPEGVSWVEARDICIKEGGDLMALESIREMNRVYTKLYSTLPYGPWIGVHDPEHNGSWVTVRGGPVSASWWYPGQPKRRGAYCTAGGPGGSLYGYMCTGQNQSFICEIPV